MGGRGASSGYSRDKEGNPKNPYGSQYHTLLTDGNIKFISANNREVESLLETMTDGRVYVTVGGNDLLQIVYFDDDRKRKKVIDLTHPHNGMKPHVHHGYFHNENDGAKGGTNLTEKENQMVDRVHKMWDNYLSKR